MDNSSVELKIQNVKKAFPVYGKNEEFYAVDDVTIHVKPGELVTLLGPSGCGKTTILRMVAGFEIPTEGAILLDGKDISKLPPNKRNVGMMFQSYALFPHMSVYENVAYGLKLQKLPEEEIKKRVKNMLELMQIEEYIDRMPNQISGGQQQRVALARAIITEPKVLLFDEPLSNLDAKLREYMRDELRRIQKNIGITSLYVTHDQAEAMAISDQVIIMKSGKLQQQGTARDIYANPSNSFVGNFMGKANFVKAENVVHQEGQNRAIADILGKRMDVKATENLTNPICMIRLEDIRIDENGEFEATVLYSSYFGNMIEYVLKIAGEKLYMTCFDDVENIKENGSQIRVQIDRNKLRLLPDNR